MSTHPSTKEYRLYPAFCFQASPTFNDWVKITAADVQQLRKEPEFWSTFAPVQPPMLLLMGGRLQLLTHISI